MLILILLGACGTTSKTTTDTFCLAYEPVRTKRSDRAMTLLCPVPTPMKPPGVIDRDKCLIAPRVRKEMMRTTDRNNARAWCCQHPDAPQCKL